MKAEFYSGKLGDFETSETYFFVEHIKIPSAGRGMKTEHYHDFYELYFYLGDGMKYFIDNKSYYVKKYDLILIDKFTYHRTSYNEKGAKERILFYLDESVFDIICSSNSYNISDEADKKTIDSNTADSNDLKRQLINLFRKKKVSFSGEFSKYFLDRTMNNILPYYYDKTNPAIGQLQARLITLELLLEIVKMDQNNLLIEDDSVLTIQEKRVSDIVNYINANFNKQITLDELSGMFYINKYYLCHIFKEVTGMSITNFINRKRLAEAKKLLKYTDYNVTEISEMVGFNNVSRFISLFKEKFEQTPRIFRESSN